MQGVAVAWPMSCVGVALNRRGLAAPAPDVEDLGPLLRTHLPWALATWSSATCEGGAPSVRFVDAGEADVTAGLAFDGRNTVSVNRSWTPDAYHLPGTIAITVVTTDHPSAMLLDADIEFDVKDAQNVLGREFGDGAPVWGVADAPTVLLHELGHLAGFDHSRVATAVMASGGGDVERQRRALTSDDVAGLCDAYPPSLGPQPSAACAPQPAIAPVVRLGGGGCSLSPSGAWSAPTVALVFLTEAWRASRRARGRSVNDNANV